MSMFFSQLLAELPMILVAVIFGAIGWRKLQAGYRPAARWLLAGMIGLLMHSCWEAYRVVMMTGLNDQFRRGEISIEAMSTHANIAGATSLLLLVLSICGVAMAAISNRNAVDPKGAA